MKSAAISVLVIVFLSPSAEADKSPVFEGAAIFEGGETRLDLKDDAKAVPVLLPAAFSGWGCYVGDTQRVGAAYVKKVTCGGKWGFVDTFASCDPKSRRSNAILRLRQPIAGSKQEVDAAEKVTISVGCSYR